MLPEFHLSFDDKLLMPAYINFINSWMNRHETNSYFENSLALFFFLNEEKANLIFFLCTESAPFVSRCFMQNYFKKLKSV